VFRHTHVAYTLSIGNVCNKRCTVKRQGREGKGRTGSSLLSRVFLLLMTRIRVVNCYKLIPNGGVGIPCEGCPNGWSHIEPGPSNETTLRQVVLNWESYRSDTEAHYGPIQDWDLSEVTDMNYIFYNLADFNGDISKWNISAVTSMKKSKLDQPFILIFFF
jgi:hypothetical protein